MTDIKIVNYQEVEFAILASKFGKIAFSSEFVDKREHWDIRLKNNDSKILIDVKGMKKIRKTDDKPSNTTHYLEIKNWSGFPSWLYAKADCFAFEMKNQYIVVNKEPLQKLITERCVDKTIYDEPILYKIYRRQSRKALELGRVAYDHIVLVENDELINISRNIIPKGNIQPEIEKICKTHNLEIRENH